MSYVGHQIFRDRWGLFDKNEQGLVLGPHVDGAMPVTFWTRETARKAKLPHQRVVRLFGSWTVVK